MYPSRVFSQIKVLEPAYCVKELPSKSEYVAVQQGFPRLNRVWPGTNVDSPTCNDTPPRSVALDCKGQHTQGCTR
ncbi:hypothetical protein PSACC_00355 [Paramicrosporidium saccamoebae]|uniref:Uncharacterized protein n=1 Tax=Paramicrosporidium saccamoebae TaxID=1246581 RepID=A0A2H9TQ93_9FUNG|nr:hypothetical protein PSACC_00355 [Paramicrosporidium saccamoebae]